MVVLLGLLLALGLLGLIRLALGHPLLPHGQRGLAKRPARMTVLAEQRNVVVAAAVAVVVLVASRNLVYAVIAGGAVVLYPLIDGGGKAERAELTKLEALAQWAESLRDLAQKGAGLESVIPKTSVTAAEALAVPLRHLSFQLEVRVPLPQALGLFADEVDHASADLVVGALALAARQRKGQLSRVLSALSASLRDELEQRTRIMRERNGVRREAAQVAGLSALLVFGGSLLSPPSLPGATSVTSQVLPLVLAGAFFMVFARMRTLAEPEKEPRFLSSASDVLEAASYRPKGVDL